MHVFSNLKQWKHVINSIFDKRFQVLNYYLCFRNQCTTLSDHITFMIVAYNGCSSLNAAKIDVEARQNAFMHNFRNIQFLKHVIKHTIFTKTSLSGD